MDRDQSLVNFSVDEVKFVNDGRERHKATLYVQNRSSSSKKIRVAVAKHSDSVSVVGLHATGVLVLQTSTWLGSC